MFIEEFGDIDRQRGQTHSGALDRDPLAAVGAGVAEHISDRVVLLGPVQVVLGHPFRPQRVAWEEDFL